MKSLILFLTLAATAVAQSNITASTCANPDGFTSCFNIASEKAAVCEKSPDQNVQLACGCEWYEAEIACALEHCWNVVYGCEYQHLTTTYLTYCASGASVDIPYYPAPENAPGGCSCNLGYVYYNLTNTFTAAAACSKETSLSMDHTFGCICCEESSAYTALYDICPDTDPSLLDYSYINGMMELLDEPISDCGPYFSEFNCVADLGYSSIGTLSYLTATPTTSATGTLYVTGSSSLTSPVSSVVSWSYNTVSFTVTASGVGSTAAAGTTGSASGSETSSGSDSSSTGASGSSSSTSASSSSSSSSSSSATLSAIGSMAVACAMSIAALMIAL